MDITFFCGVLGALVLMMGAAYPVKKVKHPTHSVKNWLFVVGGIIMFVYSILSYLAGGALFFVLLQVLVNIASLLMMLNMGEKINVLIILSVGVGLMVWALSLFEGYNTVFFVLGLIGIALGYAFETGTFRRNLLLALGGCLIAVFSYAEANWIFFWLNVFFAVFSGHYAFRLRNSVKSC